MAVIEDFEDTTYNVTFGSSTWVRSSTRAHGGSWSWKSNNTANSTTSNSNINVPVGATSLTFWYYVSTESGFDFFRFFIDGVQQFEASGEGGWTQAGPYDMTGVSSIRFRYAKDASEDAGDNACYVDDIEFATGAPEVTGAVSLSADADVASIPSMVEVKAAVDLTAEGVMTTAYEVPKVFGEVSLSAEGSMTDVPAKVDVKGVLALSVESSFGADAFIQAPPIIDPPTFPYNSVEIQFVDGVWTDVTPYFRGATVHRGSSKVDSPVLRYEAGTAEIALDNRDRRFDPTNLSGPYVENFATDTGDQEFTSSQTFTFGHAVSIAVKSAAGQNASIINVTSKASGTTSSYSCDKPSGTVSGKRMIAVASCDVGSDTNLTISGGTSWGTPILSESSGDGTIQTRVWSKIAGGSEPSTYTMGQASGADGICAIAVLDGADTSTAPIAVMVDQPERKLFVAPGVSLFGTNDLDMRWCAGNGAGTSGVQWQSPTSEGFTEYADKQSQSYTSGVLAARPLTDFGSIGTETRVITMRPVRISSLRKFYGPTKNLIENPSYYVCTLHWY